jgi:hypothetical protein
MASRFPGDRIAGAMFIPGGESMFSCSWMKVAVLSGLLLVLGAPPLSATGDEVVSILGGTFVFENGQGRLDVSGNKNFALRAGVTISSGVFNAWSQCNSNLGCPPGSSVDLDAAWSDSDLLSGAATLKEATYERVGSADSDSTARVGFSGSVIMPPIGDVPVSVNVPFDFAGLFTYNLSAPGAEPQRALLSGGGRVTLTLRPSPEDPSVWRIDRLVFEFSPIGRR